MPLIILHYMFRICNSGFYSTTNWKPSFYGASLHILTLDAHAHLTIEAQVMGKRKVSHSSLYRHTDIFYLDIVSVCRYNDNGDDYEYQ